MRNPVCGYSNGKQYDNKCELHKEECTMGQVIGVMQGPCKSKYYMSIIQFNLNISEFTRQYSVLSWSSLKLLFSGLLQKDLFKGWWSLKEILKQIIVATLVTPGLPSSFLSCPAA